MGARRVVERTAGSSGRAEFQHAQQVYRHLRSIAETLGVDLEVIEQALPRLAALAVEQGRRAGPAREQVVASLLADLDLLDPLPGTSVAQARRMAATRNRLLASGAWTVPALAEARGTKEGSVRAWVKRHRDAHRLVTVTVHGEVFVPALLLDETVEPLRDLAQVLEPLVAAGMDGWAIWLWLDTPSGWLEGVRPADLLAAGDLEPVVRAARSQAANAVTGG